MRRYSSFRSPIHLGKTAQIQASTHAKHVPRGVLSILCNPARRNRFRIRAARGGSTTRQDAMRAFGGQMGQRTPAPCAGWPNDGGKECTRRFPE
jgi:hypothetical protein